MGGEFGPGEVQLHVRNVLATANVRSLKMTSLRSCAHARCEISFLILEPIKSCGTGSTDISLFLFLSLSLWAQHETQETASLIITYLSVCPPQGPPVTTADVPHWQARNALANLHTSRRKKKSCTTMSLTRFSIKICPRGGITMTTSGVGEAQVYYSIFGFQLASVAVRL